MPLQWAMTQNNLGNALTTLGERENGTERLLEAVEAYRDALKEWTRERVPLDWATTQNNLGNAQALLSERLGVVAEILIYATGSTRRPAVNPARHARPDQVRGARGSAPLRGRPCGRGFDRAACSVLRRRRRDEGRPENSTAPPAGRTKGRMDRWYKSLMKRPAA